MPDHSKCKQHLQKRGRKKIEFDIERVHQLGFGAASFEDMAAEFDCSVDTIRDRMREKDSEFSKAYKKGKAKGNFAIRQAQMQNALNGNSTIQIWLGKQRLEQTDNRDINQEEKDTVIVNITH